MTIQDEKFSPSRLSCLKSSGAAGYVRLIRELLHCVSSVAMLG